MKNGNLVAALAALVITSALAETAEYSATEAAKHVGEPATVTDKVERAHQAQGGRNFLNMGGARPNETFTVFIPADAAEKFADWKKYEGAAITVTGKITAHNDKPEITVNTPNQITVKEAARGKDESPPPSSSPG
jgi:hypothetical protein